MSELRPLIEQVKADTHTHVILFLTDSGIHWRGESESACRVMADIIGNCKVMTREKFIEDLYQVVNADPA